MSPNPSRRIAQPALVFAALGDRTRLALVSRLAQGKPESISDLASRTAITRQAITKHLRVLERAGVVRGVRSGREKRFALELQAIDGLQAYLRHVSREWDDGLSRLKKFVEK